MGLVIAFDGWLNQIWWERTRDPDLIHSTYTSIIAWEAVIGTIGDSQFELGVGSPSGICTLQGSFDEDGIILDYTNNTVEGSEGTGMVYDITGDMRITLRADITPTSHVDSNAGIITIITSTILTNLRISGKIAGLAEEWINTGIDININGEESAKIARVTVQHLGEYGGFDSIGIKLDGLAGSDKAVDIRHCVVTDIKHYGGQNAYGISLAYGDRNIINRDNEPDITVRHCTAHDIRSQNDANADPNESFGFKITDVSGINVKFCLSHKITGINTYFGGEENAKVLCFGGDDNSREPVGRWRWGTDLGMGRALLGYNQSSDRTGDYVGIETDINDFTGAPGRPDPTSSGFFDSANEIHDLKIAYVPWGDAEEREISMNGVWGNAGVGANTPYKVIYVGSNRTGPDDYTSLTAALIGARTNPTYDAIVGLNRRRGVHGNVDLYLRAYLLGTTNYPYLGGTWAVFYMSGGDFTEKITGGVFVSGSGVSEFSASAGWEGNVFTGGKFSLEHEGYGDNVLDFGGDVGQIPNKLIVQHIEVDTHNNSWGYGIKADARYAESALVHNCIVHSSGYMSVGIKADVVTTSLVYGKINEGIHASHKAYNNTVVLDNVSLTGTGIFCSKIVNNLVLTSGTNFSSYGGSKFGNISDSRTQVNNYFTDAANDDYTLKIDSYALDSGVVPTVLGGYEDFLPIWPYVGGSTTGVPGSTSIDDGHWFIDGGYVGADLGVRANRFRTNVAVSGFDTGWDERHGQRTSPQTPFIAFMDF